MGALDDGKVNLNVKMREMSMNNCTIINQIYFIIIYILL